MCVHGACARACVSVCVCVCVCVHIGAIHVHIMDLWGTSTF